jgi:hypothetical protein
MAVQASNLEWYLVRNDKQYGPLSELELQKFIDLGHLEPNDLLWREGFNEWRFATAVFPELHKVPDPSVDSSIIVGKPVVDESPMERGTSPIVVVLALFLIVLFSGAASYRCFRGEWPLALPSTASPEERGATSIKLEPDTVR